MKVGASYYPEVIDPAEWERDLLTAREIGLSCLRCGEFAWSAFSPDGESWHAGWALRFLELAHRLDFDVVWCTPSATPPPWAFDRLPGLSAVNVDGHVTPIGIRRHYCPSHDGYRALCAETAARLVRDLGAAPAVRGWQVDNEIAGDGFTCWCEGCGSAFRRWLEQRYGSLDELNCRWQTDVWSQRYTRWEQIPVPAAPFFNHAPALRLAYRRFRSDCWLAFYQAQADALRAEGAKRVTTNFYNYTWDVAFDQHRWRPHLDVVGVSHYLEQESPSRFQLALLNGIDSRPLWVLEQKAGQQRAQNLVPDDLSRLEQHLRICAEAGAEVACYWHLRQHSAGCEMEHGAVLRHDGRPTRIARAIRDAIRATKNTQPCAVRDDVLLVFDFDQHWAQEMRPAAGARWSYVEQVESCWHAAARAVFGAMPVGSWRDLSSQHRLVLLPLAQMRLPGMHERLRALLQEGATVITTADYGRLDTENNVVREAPLSQWLADAAVPPLEMLHLADGTAVAGTIGGTRAAGSLFWSVPEDGAETIGEGALELDGLRGPLMLDLAVGAGRLVVLTTAPDADTLQAVLRQHTPAAQVQGA